MKEINNWEAVIKNVEGKEKIALPLPGCTIKGEVEEKMIEIETIDVDTSNLIIIDRNGSKYLLSGASKGYINKIETCILYKERENEEDGVER